MNEPYYKAYEKRYQAAFSAGAEHWGHSPDDEVLYNTLKSWKWKAAVAGFSFGIAALTGGLRMASGNHFFTDVLTGATIGTACGFIIPALHHQKSRSEKDFDITTADAIPPIISFNIGF